MDSKSEISFLSELSCQHDGTLTLALRAAGHLWDEGDIVMICGRLTRQLNQNKEELYHVLVIRTGHEISIMVGGPLFGCLELL